MARTTTLRMAAGRAGTTDERELVAGALMLVERMVIDMVGWWVAELREERLGR
jgi:hypothetical protein